MQKFHCCKFLSTLSSVTKMVIMLVATTVLMPLFSSSASAQTKPVNKTSDPAPVTLKVQQLADHLQAPTDIAFPGNGDVWITEQTGKIRVIKNGKLTDAPLT